MADSYTVVQNSCTLECEWNDRDNGIIVFIYWTSYFFLSCAYHKIPVQSLPPCSLLCLLLSCYRFDASREFIGTGVYDFITDLLISLWSGERKRFVSFSKYGDVNTPQSSIHT
jgi:hypothetical protein